MNNKQFQMFLTALDSLIKQLSKQDQEIIQFIVVVKKSNTKKKDVESSIHNSANKPKISIKLSIYSGELNENIFL